MTTDADGMIRPDWPVLPAPVSDEQLGWNIYAGGGTFIGFAPCPGLDEKLERQADELAAEIEGLSPG